MTIRRWLVRFLPAAAATGALALSAWAQTYSLGTFAGGALPENVAGASASLGNIYGAAVDAAGNLYLSLGDYDLVVKMDAATGMLTRVAGNGTHGYSGDGQSAAAAQLANPAGLAIDASGNLYIADAGNHRIRKVSSGVITTFAGSGEAGYSGDGGPAADAAFDAINDLAMNPKGDLFLSDSYNHVIRRISGSTVTTVAGTGTYGYNGDNILATAAQLAVPAGIGLDSGGNLYIADGYNHRVRKVSASTGIITTVAGNGTAGFAGDGKAATAANLKAPADITVDAGGNLYIADLGNNRIRMVGANGNISTVAGNGNTTYTGDSGNSTAAGLASPGRVLADLANGLYYIVDGCRLRRVTGQVIATAAGGAAPAGENGAADKAQLGAPQGVAADRSGNIFISDAGTGRVLKVTSGTLARVAGTGTQGFSGENVAATTAQLSTPAGIAVDASGNLYIADSQNARIRKVAGGTITTIAGGGTTPSDNGPANKAQLLNPLGIAVDAAGNYSITDGNRVRTVSAATGNIATTAGTGSGGYQGDGGPGTAAYVSAPDGLAFDSAGNLLLADSGNNRLRMVSSGTITTIAGNGTYGASGNNGAPTAAMLSSPQSVAVDTVGDIYITDDFRVLKVSKGKITTIAGLVAPQGIAVDPAGNVYVAEPATHRVRVLTPAGTGCAVTIPSTLQAPATGGPAAVNIQTAAQCPWTIESLPSWITVNGYPFSTGPGAAALQIAANPYPPRSSTIVVGGQNVVVSQAGVLTIAGQITGRTGSAMSGVTVNLTGARSAAVTTDSGGNFSFTGLNSSDSFTVTPSLAGYAFVPATLTYSNVGSNPTPSFVAWNAPILTGIAPVFGSTAPKTFAAGEIVSLYGTDLCDTASASPTLPDRIASCIVVLDGTNLRLYFGSPGQINAVLPQAVATGSHQLLVRRYTSTAYSTLVSQTAALPLTIDRIAMAFIERDEDSTVLPVAQYPDGGLAGAARPIKSGDYLTLYLTGLGRKSQTFTEGAAPNRASPAIESVQVQIQGTAAQVTYAGVQPQFPGLDQITLLVPKYTVSAGKGTATLRITAPATGQVVSYELPAN